MLASSNINALACLLMITMKMMYVS